MVFYDKRDAIDHARRNLSTGLPTSFAQNFAATYDQFVQEEMSVSELGQLSESFETFADRFEERTGERLTNPYKAVPLGAPYADPKAKRQELMERAHEQFKKRAQENPELQDDLPPFPTRQRVFDALAVESKERRERLADIRSRSTFLGDVGMVSGTLAGGVTDPMILASLPLGASAGQSILRAGLTEFLIGSGVEGLIQPQVFKFKENIDSPYTVDQAVLNTILAGAGGAAGVAALRGGGKAIEAIRKFPQTRRQLLTDFRRASRAPDAHRGPNAQEQAAERVLERELDVEARNPYREDDDAAAAAYTSTMNDTLAHVTREGTVPPNLDPPTHGVQEQFAASGLSRFDPDQVEIDAERFQFKSGGDEFGVTERLQGVTRFDERLAGVSLVFEQEDGRVFIADGHQRLALAKRAKASGQENVGLNAYILRESDGITAEQARAIAAFKNIAEGTGTAVDTAKVIREMGERGLPELPPRSALVRQGRELANLGDDAFGMAVNEVVPANYAAIVGRLIDDPAEQAAVMRVLSQTNPANTTQAEAIIRQAMEAGMSRETQSTLFGEEFITESLFNERARLLDNALRRIRQDRQTFKTLVTRDDTIQEAGNQLSTQANQQRLSQDEQILQAIQKLASRKGDISDALTAAARSFKRGDRKLAGATDDFLSAVRRAARDGALDGERVSGGGRGREDVAGETAADVDAGAARAEYAEQTLDDMMEAGRTTSQEFDDAVASEAQRILDGQAEIPSSARSAAVGSGAFSTEATSAPPSRQAAPSQVSTTAPPSGRSTSRATAPSSLASERTFGEFSVGAIDPSTGRKILQASNNVGALLNEANRLQPGLRTTLDEITRPLDDAQVVGVRVKDRPGLNGKIEQGRPPETISDYIGGRVWAGDKANLNALQDEIRRRFDVVEVDDFLERPKGGYRAVHMQVNLGNGMTAEIQLVPEGVGRVQEDAHKLYDKWKRKTELTAAERQEMEADVARATEMFEEGYQDFLARTEARNADLQIPVGQRVDPDTGELQAETMSARDLLDDADRTQTVADEFKGCLS